MTTIISAAWCPLSCISKTLGERNSMKHYVDSRVSCQAGEKKEISYRWYWSKEEEVDDRVKTSHVIKCNSFHSHGAISGFYISICFKVLWIIFMTTAACYFMVWQRPLVSTKHHYRKGPQSCTAVVRDLDFLFLVWFQDPLTVEGFKVHYWQVVIKADLQSILITLFKKENKYYMQTCQSQDITIHLGAKYFFIANPNIQIDIYIHKNEVKLT